MAGASLDRSKAHHASGSRRGIVGVAGRRGSRGNTVPHLVGSSRYRAVADDARKDEDNAGFVLELPPGQRDEWLRRIRWIRLVDRLAENQALEPDACRFSNFIAEWRLLRASHAVRDDSPHLEVWTGIHERTWGVGAGDMGARFAEAWNGYLGATAAYHCANLELDSLEQHDDMMAGLSGSIFQLFPYLSMPQWRAIRAFGVLDQFFNNLRDLQEDAEHRICYFPTEVLRRFGLTRAEMLDGSAGANPGYLKMMSFWMDEYLPSLRERARPFVERSDLHPSLRAMVAWCERRYERIEQVLRVCDFDARVFPRFYWSLVRLEVAYPTAALAPSGMLATSGSNDPAESLAVAAAGPAPSSTSTSTSSSGRDDDEPTGDAG